MKWFRHFADSCITIFWNITYTNRWYASLEGLFLCHLKIIIWYKYSFRICICVSSAVFTGTVRWCGVSYSARRCTFACLSPLNIAPIWCFLFIPNTRPAFCWTVEECDPSALNIQSSARLLLWTIFCNKQKINFPPIEICTCALKYNLAIMDWNWGVPWCTNSTVSSQLSYILNESVSCFFGMFKRQTVSHEYYSDPTYLFFRF